MLTKESIGIKGRLSIIVRNKDNEIIDTRDVDNLVVSTGKNLIASRLVDATDPVISHMWVSERNPSPANGSSVLADMGTSGDDTLLPAQTTSVTRTNNELVYTASFAFTAAYGIRSAALSVGGVASSCVTFSLTNFPIVNVANNDEITINWTISIV